jgi:hypothetical protein
MQVESSLMKSCADVLKLPLRMGWNLQEKGPAAVLLESNNRKVKATLLGSAQ